MPYLQSHCDGAHQHGYGHHILHYKDYFAVDCLCLEPERTAYNLNGLCLQNQQGRHDTGQDAQHDYETENQQHVGRCDGFEDGDLIFQHSGNCGGEGFGQQYGQQHGNAADEGAF
ncbi:unknown [Bacteroides sp. CAG:1060]|nr:unknown [Bacteroides sp. CAG:1060]